MSAAEVSLADKSAELLASWFGCGRFPTAPGTVGSLGALPLHFALRALGPVPYWTGVAVVSALGIWASQRVSRLSGEKDPQWVVIDEVAGTLIAMGLVSRRSLAVRLAAMLVFRVLDITKPGPIDKAQYLKPAGLGIMADDLLAGVAAGVMTRWL